MPTNRKLEYTILDLIQNSAAVAKTRPLNLGGIPGSGGGIGGPPGGFIGTLPQHRVSYDTTEAATPDTVGSGTLVDNLNHIRYRISLLESSGGGPGTFSVVDLNNSITYENVDTLSFVGPSVIVTDLGGGNIEIDITASGGGTASSGIDHIYNENHTGQVPGTVFSTDEVYISGTLQLYYNGVRQRRDVDYVELGDFITYSTFFETESGDSLVVDYDILGSGESGGGGGDIIISGGGGTSWTLVVDENGSSMSSFTGVGGTWSSDGTVLEQEDDTDSWTTLKYNTQIDTSLGVIMEADVKVMPYVAGDFHIAGVVTSYAGDDSTAGGSTGVLWMETDTPSAKIMRYLADSLTLTFSWTTDTWYKMRIKSTGGLTSLYIDDVLMGIAGTPPGLDARYVGLTAFNKAQFKNIKVWIPDAGV